MRRAAFTLVLAFVFLRVSFLYQILTHEFGSGFFILYLIIVPLAITFVLAGGFRRVLRARTALYWTSFLFWMGVTVPFSPFVSESGRAVIYYLRGSFPTVFFLAGSAVRWSDCRRLFLTIAAAGGVNLLSVLLYGNPLDQRLKLAFSNIANSNDLAAHLVFLLPFFVLIVASGAYDFLLRFSALAASVLAGYFVLATGSRGGLLAVTTATFVLLLSGPKRLRIATLVALLGTAALAFARPLPEPARRYLATLWSDEAVASNRAARGSANERLLLLKESVVMTLDRPVVGVGPRQFSKFMERRHGIRKTPHNTYTEISSEVGLPGALLFLAAIFSTFRLVITASRFRERVGEEIESTLAAHCLLGSLLGYGTAAVFLSHGYLFYFPLLSGIAICLDSSISTRPLSTDR